MYACVCHAVPEERVRACADRGLRHVVATTRAGSGCGTCVSRLRGLCSEAVAATGSAGDEQAGCAA